MINKSYNREMIKAKLNNWGVVDSRIAFLNESSGTENLSITLLNQEEIKAFSLELANLYYDAQTNPDVYKLKARLTKDVINNLDMLIKTYLFYNNFNATLLGDMHNVILKFIEANKEQLNQSDFKGATQYVEEQLQTFKQDLENGPQLRENIAPLEESRNTVRNMLEELSNEHAKQNDLYKYCNSIIQVKIDSINRYNTHLQAERLIDRDMDLGILRSKSDAAHSKMKEINTLIEEYRKTEEAIEKEYRPLKGQLDKIEPIESKNKILTKINQFLTFETIKPSDHTDLPHEAHNSAIDTLIPNKSNSSSTQTTDKTALIADLRNVKHVRSMYEECETVPSSEYDLYMKVVQKQEELEAQLKLAGVVIDDLQ